MKEGKQRNSLKIIINNNLFGLKIAWKAAPAYIVAKIIFQIANSIVMFFEHVYGMKIIIEAVQYNKPFSSVVTYYLIISPFILGLYTFESFFWPYYNIKSTEKLHCKIMTLLYDKTIQLDLGKYDDSNFYGKLVWNITQAPSQIDKLVDNVSSIFGGLTMIGIGVVMFYNFDKAGILFACCSLIISLLIQTKLNKTDYDLDVSLNNEQKRRDYIYRLFYMKDYAKEFRLNKDLKQKQFEVFKESSRNIVYFYKKFATKRIWYSFIVDFLCKIFTLNGIYVIYLIYMAMIKQTLSYGNVVALYRTASWQFSSGVFSLVTVIPQFSKSSLYMESIREFLRLKNKIVNDADGQKAEISDDSMIEFCNVSFGYNSNKQILHDINLKIHAGQKIAIVGYNGAGKSTFVKLLLRLYDPNSGEILLNNKNIKEYNLDSFRKQFSVVFQNFQSIAATVAENVVMDNKPYDRGRVENALIKSGFEKRLKKMAKGIDTQLTREFDDEGVNLSGGEEQKVALARVFYNDSPVVILDEPSSAMDPISEYNMYKNLIEYTDNKTLIFISHRLSTTKLADKIIMLENGWIIEQGTHDELMELKGKYAEMFEIQSSKYEYKEQLDFADISEEVRSTLGNF